VPDPAISLQRRFGESLRAARKEHGLSQEKVALEAEISLTYFGEVERGEKMPSLDVVLRLAKALGLTGQELLGRAKL
jgi:transcriptional regulator with XRE-family HTH domain